MPAMLRPGRFSSRPLVMYVGRPKAAVPARPWRPPAPGPERRRGHANPAPVVADPGPYRTGGPASILCRAPGTSLSSAWNGQRGRDRAPSPYPGAATLAR
jgi:hypothetical protein